MEPTGIQGLLPAFVFSGNEMLPEVRPYFFMARARSFTGTKAIALQDADFRLCGGTGVAILFATAKGDQFCDAGRCVERKLNGGTALDAMRTTFTVFRLAVPFNVGFFVSDQATDDSEALGLRCAIRSDWQTSQVTDQYQVTIVIDSAGDDLRIWYACGAEDFSYSPPLADLAGQS